MKVIICLIGLATLVTLTGCEEEREHEHRGGYYGGAYQGPEYPGYGQGEYRGYPNYYNDYPPGR